MFIDSNPNPIIEAEQPLAGRVNYLNGSDPAKWQQNIPTYAAVMYRNLYPGIDVRFYRKQGTLEYDLIVAPGADPKQVQFRYNGADDMSLNEVGDLHIALGDGKLIQRRPVVYQDIKGQRRSIEADFVLTATSREDEITAGFQLAAYDSDYPLLIDPVLNFATYLGGNDYDNSFAIAVDKDGRAYVTGQTWSTDFPFTDDSTFSVIFDVFVARLSSNGGNLEYATYLGGTYWEEGHGIAVDSSGRAYITGYTQSTDFPVTDNSTFSGFSDSFVARLSSNGDNLEYATYLGGTYDDDGHGIAVDNAGRAYITGYTRSTDFPVTDDSTFSAYIDAFVARFGPPLPISAEPFKASDPSLVGFAQRPVVAYNSVDREFMVAYLVPAFLDPLNHFDLRMQRMGINGQPIGPAFDPLGDFGALLGAKGRPDIAYSPTSNSYLLAVPRLDLNTMDDRVLVIEVKADGTTGNLQNIFLDAGARIFSVLDSSPVRVTYNNSLNEFVVSAQQEFIAPFYNRRIVGQRMQTDTTLLGAAMVLQGSTGETHSLEYAAVDGGRYILATDNSAGDLTMYDANLNKLRTFEVDLGELNFGVSNPDLAFGRIAGKNRMLMVWWDSNNCRIGTPVPDCPDPWDKRLGVWGVFFELPQTSPTQPLGQPFPILAPETLEQAVTNVSTELRFMPRVAYNAEAHSFYVAWREIPYMSPRNAGEQVRTHIRSAWIDYLVEDITDAFHAPLNDNILVSLVSMSNCPSPVFVDDNWTNTCPSIEDPRFPDIAAVDSFGAVVVWEQKLDFDPNGNTEIAGRALVPPAPVNNGPADASNLEKTSIELKGTLLGASIDGVTNCGQADESPDVWYTHTATSPGVLHINTCGSHDQFGTDTGMDTVISLHRPDGRQFSGACNDDAPDGKDETACDSVDLDDMRDSALQLVMHQGQTVLARVSRYGGGY